jgi:hypothetical protein
MAKMYEDDDAFDEEMKFFDMAKAASDNEEEEKPLNKRELKATEKKASSKPQKQIVASTIKVNRLVSLLCYLICYVEIFNRKLRFVCHL